MNIKKFLDISWIKTISFNIHYFGIQSIIKLPVLISKYTCLSDLRGTISYDWKNQKWGRVRIGFHTVGIIDKVNERTIWSNSGNIIFGSNISIGAGCRIGNSGTLYLGDNVAITGNTAIVCKKSISIENDSLISWDVLIMDTDFHNIFDEKGEKTNKDRGINIGNHCWIGCRATILKGSHIPQNSVIAAGSVVASNLPEESAIYSNNKILREKIRWTM